MAKCVARCRELEGTPFEILILPDAPIAQTFDDPRVKVIPTGAVHPGVKRDLALRHASGDILAFLDDDAYPVAGWLAAAVRHFDDHSVAAVGGPAITPPEDTFWQKASGAVYASHLVSGGFRFRYVPGRLRDCDDFPSCNLLVRKDVFAKVGGFNTSFWPGEDTKLCLDIVNLGMRIVYDPEVLVYHHRRTLFAAHLRQVANYALHRGYFVRKFPRTSRKISYFLPTGLVIFLLLGLVVPKVPSPIGSAWEYIFALYMAATFLSGVLSGWEGRTLRLIPVVFAGIIMTHITYGLNFAHGLVALKLKEES